MTILNLQYPIYKNNFKSDLSEKEYLREGYYRNTTISKNVSIEQKLINNALTFIFPLFWMDASSKLVGWFNRVFTYDFRYGGSEKMKVLEKINFLIIMGIDYENLKKDGKNQYIT